MRYQICMQNILIYHNTTVSYSYYIIRLGSAVGATTSCATQPIYNICMPYFLLYIYVYTCVCLFNVLICLYLFVYVYIYLKAIKIILSLPILLWTAVDCLRLLLSSLFTLPFAYFKIYKHSGVSLCTPSMCVRVYFNIFFAEVWI